MSQAAVHALEGREPLPEGPEGYGKARGMNAGPNPTSGYPARALLLVACVACLVYANTLSNGLVFDDVYLIKGQRAIRNPWNFRAILGGRYFGEIQNADPLYRPLTIWTLALNYAANRGLGLPGEHPFGFHLANILLHALVVCALCRFLPEIGVPKEAGLAAALLFAVHPIHTEAVAAVVNRSEMLAAFFGLAFLTLHARRRWTAAICCFLALWSKESAIAFLPLAIWADVCLGKKEWPRRHYVTYALATAAWLWARNTVVGGRSLLVPRPDNPLVDAPLVERLLTAGRVQLDYLRLQVWPVGLSSDYSYNQIPVVSSGSDPRFLAFAVLVAAGLSASWALRKKHPIVAFSVVGYAVLFSPTSNFLFPIGTIMGERLAYAPSLLFCLLVGYVAWEWYCKKGRTVAVLLGVVLVFYGWMSFSRNRTWADEGVFNYTQARTAPNSAKAQYGAGRQYLIARDFNRAITHLRRSLEISPERPSAWNALGSAYIEKGDLHSAVEVFQEAIGHYGNRPGLHFNLGRARQLLEEYPLAAASFRTAIGLDRTFTRAYINLGGVYFQMDRLPLAEEIWKQGLGLDPDNRSLQENLRALGAGPAKR